MPVAKHAYLRYRILNSCFSNKQKRYWSIAELIAKLDEHDIVVERRTLESDLETMRHDERLAYRAPIAYDRKEKGFYYTDPAFSIEKVPLTEEDLQALTAATNILHQYKGVQVVQQFMDVVDKLGKVVNHLKQPGNHKIVAFEKKPYYKGHDYFDALVQAITAQQPLCITYRKFQRTDPHEHVVHPYFLKEYRGRWYVLGHSETRGHIVTLGLERIVKIETAAVPFLENKTLKPKEYFEHTLGITLGSGPVEEIELWFSPLLAPYLKTQHLHHTQKTVREDEAGLVIGLKLIPNPELTQLILSYGADVKVLKPTTLQECITEIWEKAIKDKGSLEKNSNEG
jgi:predicted DNA-binding transcriptional regulator YafY